MTYIDNAWHNFLAVSRCTNAVNPNSGIGFGEESSPVLSVFPVVPWFIS